MDNHSIIDTPDPNIPTSVDWPPPMSVILVLIASGILSLMFAAFVAGLWQVQSGHNIMEALQGMDSGADFAQRQSARLIQGLSHLFMFIIPSYFALRYYQRGRRKMGNTRFEWSKELGLKDVPTWVWLGLGILLMAISLPVVHYSYELNKALPLPDWMRNSEADINKALEGFLTMESPIELIINVLIVAVLPAIGEELMFRGVIQHQFMRLMKPWLAIIISGAIFSAIHMQFEGFIPRWIMGIVLGWLFWKSRNLWVPIIVHLLNNGLQVIGYYFYKDESDIFDVDSTMEIPHWIGILSLIAVVFFFIIYEKKNSKDEEEKETA